MEDKLLFLYGGTRMFSFPFKKKENVENHFLVSTDYMLVIKPDEIAEMDAPMFGKSHYGKELEYKTYLECIQPLVEEYERTGRIHTLEYNSFADIKKNQEERKILDNFNYSFLNCANWVDVEKRISGKYRVCSNGRHRMYVAKKYGLKLLVHVTQEER